MGGGGISPQTYKWQWHSLKVDYGDWDMLWGAEAKDTAGIGKRLWNREREGR